MKERKYGYCRVSTMQQNIERQIRNIKSEYPDAIIVTDEYTGTRLDRPGWMKLSAQLKKGDVVIFDEVSRMSRDAEEGFNVYQELYEKGVDLIFLKEPHINTTSYREALKGSISVDVSSGDADADELISGIMTALNKFMLAKVKADIKKAFGQAETEVQNLRQRTREGIETARLNGKQIGQPKGAKLNTKKAKALKAMIVEYSKDFKGNNSDVEVMAIINGKDKIVYGTKKVTRINQETGEKERVIEELTLKPHDGLTKSGKTNNRYINRGTYYKYKRELKGQ